MTFPSGISIDNYNRIEELRKNYTNYKWFIADTLVIILNNTIAEDRRPLTADKIVQRIHGTKNENHKTAVLIS